MQQLFLLNYYYTQIKNLIIFKKSKSHVLNPIDLRFDNFYKHVNFCYMLIISYITFVLSIISIFGSIAIWNFTKGDNAEKTPMQKDSVSLLAYGLQLFLEFLYSSCCYLNPADFLKY